MSVSALNTKCRQLATASAPTLLEPMEAVAVDISLGDREKWVGREGGRLDTTLAQR